MKISPDPDWETQSSHATPMNDNLDDLLADMLANFSASKVVRVWGKNGGRLGSFTPEWFLDLTREYQLRFLAVAQRMHDSDTLESARSGCLVQSRMPDAEAEQSRNSRIIPRG